MRSPKNGATIPPNGAMTSVQHRWYSTSRARKSPGSNRDARAVDPTRPQDITVSCRLSLGSGGGALRSSSAGAPNVVWAGAELRGEFVPFAQHGSVSGISLPPRSRSEHPVKSIVSLSKDKISGDVGAASLALDDGRRAGSTRAITSCSSKGIERYASAL